MSKLPDLGKRILELLEQEESREPGRRPVVPPSIFEAVAARRILTREGYEECPTWAEIAGGRRPPARIGWEPGEWAHGWQFFASRKREEYFRKNTVLPSLDNAAKALLHSQSGACAARVLSVIPTRPEFRIRAAALLTILRRRLRLPIPTLLFFF